MDRVEYTGAIDRTTALDRLRAAECGVLALAASGAADAVPVSYRYDDGAGRLLFRLADSDEARRLAATTTPSACFVVYGETADGDSWSVLVEGSVEELPDGRRADAELPDPFRVFDGGEDAVEYHLYALTPTSVTGRTTLG